MPPLVAQLRHRQERPAGGPPEAPLAAAFDGSGRRAQCRLPTEGEARYGSDEPAFGTIPTSASARSRCQTTRRGTPPPLATIARRQLCHVQSCADLLARCAACLNGLPDHERIIK